MLTRLDEFTRHWQVEERRKDGRKGREGKGGKRYGPRVYYLCFMADGWDVKWAEALQIMGQFGPSKQQVGMVGD